jgi:cytochrome c6
MVKKLGLWLGAIALGGLLFCQAAWADSTREGAALFQANCRMCHSQGRNLIVPEKNLQQSTLKRYAMNSQGAIARQVKYGKNVMPAFGESLSDEQIEAIAAYVLEQAAQGWPSAS